MIKRVPLIPATEYEFKWSNVSADLSPSRFPEHGVLVNSSLVPAPGTNGTTQTLTIAVPAGLGTDSFFLAMRTRDDRGETGCTGHIRQGDNGFLMSQEMRDLPSHVTLL